jgi:hypothetical protein
VNRKHIGNVNRKNIGNVNRKNIGNVNRKHIGTFNFILCGFSINNDLFSREQIWKCSIYEPMLIFFYHNPYRSINSMLQYTTSNYNQVTSQPF